MNTNNPLEVARNALREQIAHHTAEIERLTRVLDQVTDAIPPSFGEAGSGSVAGQASEGGPTRASRKR